MSIILGIDPGSRLTGYGIIQRHGRHLHYVASGCIRVTGTAAQPLTLAEKLKRIHNSVAELITQFQPDEFAIEQVFMARNPDSALKLGQARGAAIVAAAEEAEAQAASPREMRAAQAASWCPAPALYQWKRSTPCA